MKELLCLGMNLEEIIPLPECILPSTPTFFVLTSFDEGVIPYLDLNAEDIPIISEREKELEVKKQIIEEQITIIDMVISNLNSQINELQSTPKIDLNNDQYSNEYIAIPEDHKVHIKQQFTAMLRLMEK
jgi:hypothetical protein